MGGSGGDDVLFFLRKTYFLPDPSFERRVGSYFHAKGLLSLASLWLWSCIGSQVVMAQKNHCVANASPDLAWGPWRNVPRGKASQ